MKLLFLTSRLPYPPYRGDKLKIWNLISRLSRRHELYLLSIIQHKSDEQWLPALREVCKEVQVVHVPTYSSMVQCLLALPGVVPFQVAYFRSKEVRTKLNEMVMRIRPDILHTHLIRMASYTAHIDSIPKVLDMTDAVSLYLARFREQHHNPIGKRLIGMELRRMSAFEQIIPFFDRGLVCSETDKKFLESRVPNAKLSLLYNGIDLETFTPRTETVEEPLRIIFTGNMDYYPNADASIFFVKDIFPIIKQRFVGAQFFIVGQNPPRRVRALASKDVVVTGFVEDIRIEYLRSAIAVSPVRFGAGTLNKVLEPLALRVPVVSTPIGFEGLHLVPGEDILIADNVNDFAMAVCSLLADPSYRRRLADAASIKIRNSFGWDRITADLERIYDEVRSAHLDKTLQSKAITPR